MIKAFIVVNNHSMVRLCRFYEQLGVDKQRLDEAKGKAAIIALVTDFSVVEVRGGTKPQPEPVEKPAERLLGRILDDLLTLRSPVE